MHTKSERQFFLEVRSGGDKKILTANLIVWRSKIINLITSKAIKMNESLITVVQMKFNNATDQTIT